jgi:hypothetical protein
MTTMRARAIDQSTARSGAPFGRGALVWSTKEKLKKEERRKRRREKKKRKEKKHRKICKRDTPVPSKKQVTTNVE